MATELWFNPRCSKCRQALELLEAADVQPELYLYLETGPSRERIEALLAMLVPSDLIAILRRKEALFASLGLADASRDARIDAMVAHPELIERPILIHENRAIVARPPELVHELLR